MLQGSIVNCQLSDASQQECEDKRQFLKSQLRLAWSGEAVKQGVAHAKKAEYDTALGCYKKVSPYTHTFAIGLRHTGRLHHTIQCNVVQMILSSCTVHIQHQQCTQMCNATTCQQDQESSTGFLIHHAPSGILCWTATLVDSTRCYECHALIQLSAYGGAIEWHSLLYSKLLLTQTGKVR